MATAEHQVASEELHAPRIDVEAAQPGFDNDEPEDASSALSRTEKKACKTIEKLGLKPVKGFVRCDLKHKNKPSFHVSKPCVYVIPGTTPTYVIVGSFRVDNERELLAAQHAQMMQAMARQKAAAAGTAPGAAGTSAGTAGETAKVTDEEPKEDETGLNPDDIALACEQTGRSRNEVVRALREHKGDVIEAIMELSG